MPARPAVPDPERVPVVVASGQCAEHDELVTPLDLMTRAASEALATAPGLADRVEQLSVVNIMSRIGEAPASELAGRIGLDPSRCEVTTIGGNTPQWLVNRAAEDIAAGRLSATLIAGAEAIRSSRARRHEGLARPEEPPAAAPDPVVGDDLPGVGPAETAAGMVVPLHIYPMLESALAARMGHDAAQHRRAMGELLAPFTRVAARHPVAWFREVRSADDIATPSPDNRIVADPYTKRMTAFLGSDQGAALLVCSLAEARRAGVEDRAVFVWAGADATDVRSPVARPDPSRSAGIAAAGQALFAAASSASGHTVGIDDPALFDLYSCFPVAVEAAAEALGLAIDDPRGLTVTGGLPYFGGPGNNYTTHAIATLCDRLRERTATTSPVLGVASGLGWFITKHALGLYATEPPPHGYHPGDTGAAQQAIDATAVETALEVDDPSPATVVAVTVQRGRDDEPLAAPVIVRLADGRHAAAVPEDDEVTAEIGRRDVLTLVGTAVSVEGGPPRYRLPES